MEYPNSSIPVRRSTHGPPETKFARSLLSAQAVFYIATGVWPLLHTRSFLAVTGPKTDIWLLKTLSLLITVVGGVLLQAAVRGRLTPEVRSLAAGSAAMLAAADVYYVSRGRISPVYLLDAVAEAPFVLAWAGGIGNQAPHGPKTTAISTSASSGSSPKKLATSSS